MSAVTGRTRRSGMLIGLGKSLFFFAWNQLSIVRPFLPAAPREHPSVGSAIGDYNDHCDYGRFSMTVARHDYAAVSVIECIYYYYCYYCYYS